MFSKYHFDSTLDFAQFKHKDFLKTPKTNFDKEYFTSTQQQQKGSVFYVKVRLFTNLRYKFEDFFLD